MNVRQFLHDNSPKYYCTEQINNDQTDRQTDRQRPHITISARPNHSASIKEISTRIVNNK